MPPAGSLSEHAKHLLESGSSGLSRRSGRVCRNPKRTACSFSWALSISPLIGPVLKPAPGRRQSLPFGVGTVDRVYVAMVSFAKQENMSAMSNVARAR